MNHIWITVLYKDTNIYIHCAKTRFCINIWGITKK